MHWSKTIQFRERVVHIPLPWVTGSPFCPVSALSRAFSFTPMASHSSQAFAWVHPSLSFRAFTCSLFMSKLRSCLNNCGLLGRDIGSHSFHRGDASLAFQAGVRLEPIKVLKDWKSDAVLLYLTVPLDIQVQAITLLFQHITLE